MAALAAGLHGCTGGSSRVEAQPVSPTTGGLGAGCSAEQLSCAGACVEADDPAHCGGCENACAPDESCAASAGADRPVCESMPWAGSPGDCGFSVNSSLSSAIATVGIVEWSSDLPNLSSAWIEFGLDPSYGKRAPVDLAEPEYRTLLLGMKTERTYHFRIVARSATTECASEDYTITTGPAPNNLEPPEVRTLEPSALTPGYLITGRYNGGPAFIVDEEGDVVWWFSIQSEVTSARMSYDGKHMWITRANVPEGLANVHRVSMDGLDDRDLSSAFEGQNHQLAVLPDETVAFYAYGESGCDDIKEYAPNGELRSIVNAGAAHGAGTRCHLNAIEYSPQDDTLVFSDLLHDNYTKVTRHGETVWVLGGTTSDFSGDGAAWDGQHGLDVLSPERLVFFNNGAPGSASSLAIEVELHRDSRTATRRWTYSAEPPIQNHLMGDVQRLYNGNTLVVYSSRGVVHEVSTDGTLVQELAWNLGGALGYAMKRRSLYGPPPK